MLTLIKNVLQANKHNYFVEIDYLRFAAFLLVFTSHNFFIDKENLEFSTIIQLFLNAKQVGFIGVNIFFIISGFLISYLFFKEVAEKKQFNFIQYFIRRTLRIWPMYFLVLFFSFLLEPYIGSPVNYVPFCLFYANLIMAYQGQFSSLIDHLWSISVEEQFYFSFPFVMKASSYFRRIDLFLITILLCSIWYKIYYLNNSNFINFHTLSVAYELFIGVFMGYLAFYREIKIKRNLFLISKTSSLVLFALLFCFPLHSKRFYDILMLLELSIGILFIGFVSFPTSKKYSILQHFGKLSYSMYLIHIIVIRLVEMTLIKFSFFSPFVQSFIAIPFISLFLILIFSHLMYIYIEKPILIWRNSWQ